MPLPLADRSFQGNALGTMGGHFLAQGNALR